MNFIKNNWVILLILLIGSFLRLNYDTFENGYIFDEIAMVGIAKSGNIIEILKNSALLDYHAPLYYLIISPLVNFENEWVILRLLNVVFSVLNIFVFYKIGCKLSNKKTGYIMASLLCVNHLHILITSFIKFYCLNFLIFSIIIYFLIDVIKNKKNYTKLALFNSLFCFSSTFGIVFVSIEYLILFLNQKEQIKKLTKSFLISTIGFVFYLPILIFQSKIAFQNIISPHSAYPSFSLFGLWSILNDYLTPMVNYSATQETIEGNTLLLKFLKTLIENNSWDFISLISFILFCFLPILISCFGIFKALKNNTCKQLFYISILYLFFFILLVITEITGLIPLYISNLGLVLIILTGFGIRKIENKKIGYLFLSFLLLAQIIIPNTYPIDKREEDRAKIYLCPIEYIKKTNNDNHIIATLGGRFLKAYFQNKKIYSFDNEQMSASHNKALVNLIYDKKEIKKANKKNAKLIFQNQILNEYQNPDFKNYLDKNIISKIKAHEKITLIMYSDDFSFIASKDEIKKILNKQDYNWHLTDSSLFYQLKKEDNKIITRERLADVIQSYSYAQLIKYLDKNLKRTKIEQYRRTKDNNWVKVVEINNFNKSTLWIAQNVIKGWIFVTYEKL